MTYNYLIYIVAEFWANLKFIECSALVLFNKNIQKSRIIFNDNFDNIPLESIIPRAAGIIWFFTKIAVYSKLIKIIMVLYYFIFCLGWKNALGALATQTKLLSVERFS